MKLSHIFTAVVTIASGVTAPAALPDPDAWGPWPEDKYRISWKTPHCCMHWDFYFRKCYEGKYGCENRD